MAFCIWSYIWITFVFYLVSSIPWRDPFLEIRDEFNDAAIYNAVVESMNQWQRKHDLKKNINRTKREESTICYEELGCFDASGPFGYLDMLPSKPEDINTRFLMYPARNRQRRSGSAPTEIPFEKLDEAFEWAEGGFNKSLPTKVLIHGFGSDCGYIWAYEIRSALMAVEEVNTICVDWSNGATLPNYVKASANTRLVGKQLSLLLRGLVEKNGLSLMNTHLIGFSLGAHIAGFAGAELGNLSRITGLDPAGPLFESQDTRARLDETDAAFVDVIHSNGENLILGGLGSSQPMGHVDFYPNGGRMQKGCSHLFVGAVSDIIWSSAVEGRSLCNHRRAYKFFIDSVSPRCHFPAFPCDSYDNFIAGECFPCTDERKCGNMGYYADRSKGKGQLYLITRDEEPFCAHQYLVRIETTSGSIPVKSYGKIHVTLIGDSFLNETFMLRKEDEEMKLGEAISKIVVLHPILSQPTKIKILYTAYSGWLSSGLTQWKIDKVMLMDSFGKISSICKKAQILESGVPVTLPLYPRDCDPFKNDSNSEQGEENNMQHAANLHTGYLSNKNENLNLLDIETESSRAFNSRVIKAEKLNKDENDNDLVSEVVEPVLKIYSMKNGRSHDPEKHKPEITEPILGPTTLRTNRDSSAEVHKSLARNEKTETDSAANSKQWMSKEHSGEKWKRQDESKALKDFDSVNRSQQAGNPNPLDAIVTTVQILPQRLARMFEQAEKYARETILPLVSTYTPRLISDFIGPKEEPKYVPLHYEEDEIQQTSSTKKIDKTSSSQSRSLPDKSQILQLQRIEDATTPSSHIQKITKKKPEKTEQKFSHNLPSDISINAFKSGDSTITSSFNDINSLNIIKTSPNFNIRIDYGQPQRSKQPDKRKRKMGNEDLLYTDRNNVGVSFVDNNISSTNLTLIQTLTSALQNLPDNFSKVLSQVQNYTRTNIIPFVQSYNPRRFSDLIWIRSQPNNIMKIEKNQTNLNKVPGQNLSITWAPPKDFNEIEHKSINNISNISNFKNLPCLKINNGSLNRQESFKEELEQSHNISKSLNYIQRSILQNISGTTKQIPTGKPLPTTTVLSEITFPSSNHVDVSTNRFVSPTIITSALNNINNTKLLFTNFNSTLTEKRAPWIANVTKTSISHLFPKNTPASNNLNITKQEIPTSSIGNISPTIKESSKNLNIQKTDSILNYIKSHILQNITNGIERTTLKSISTTIALPDTTSANPKFESVSTNFVSPAIPPLLNNEEKYKNVTSIRPVLKKKSVHLKLANLSQVKNNHIQRIPRRGEAIEYILPQSFTIVINPNDLTTTIPVTMRTSTTSNSQILPTRKFSSYIQKIPRRGNRKVPIYKPKKSLDKWAKYFNLGIRFISVKNKHGADVTYQITSDGRFEA